jgi:MFS family permease
MNAPPRPVTPAIAAMIGLASLAAAMGIGRFSFTPLLPLMQDRFGLSLADGAWLATANYLGYLAGALASFWFAPRPGTAVKAGLLFVAATTAAMGLTSSFHAWVALRLVSGAASAYVLVGASAWSLAHLAHARRGELAGWVFAGVGIGIAVAGLVTLLAGVLAEGPDAAWIALGIGAVAVAAWGWKALAAGAPGAPASTGDDRTDSGIRGRDAWVLVACYGAFGFGYIIPATFIPAAARALIANPAIFGWVWPLFGAAAAASTVVASRAWAGTEPRKLAAWGLAVMAAGLLTPALHGGLFALFVSALLVGGTFMVVTMAVLQEARRIASRSAAKLMAVLTASFAIGQLVGPMVVGWLTPSSGDLTVPNVVAAIVLGGSAAALALVRRN